MQKDILYSKVKQATEAENRSIVSKAIEEFKELRDECDKAIESLQDSGTITNITELIDEVNDVFCTSEQITGEREMVMKLFAREKFKIEVLAYRLATGSLFPTKLD
jgi:hypothetical protein